MTDPENTSIKQVWQRVSRPVEFPTSPYSLPKATLESLRDIPEGEARWLDCNGVNFEALEASTNGVWTISNQIGRILHGPIQAGAILAYRTSEPSPKVRRPHFTPEWIEACERNHAIDRERILNGGYDPEEDSFTIILLAHELSQEGDIPNAIKMVDLQLARKTSLQCSIDSLLESRHALSQRLAEQSLQTPTL